MEKLELKHLAGYLPYGLQILDFVNGGNCLINDTYQLSPKNIHRCLTFAKDTEKPILHPLSDLTKEIEVNGEKFVPIDKIAIYSSEYYLIEQIKIGMVEVIVWEMLLKWHFDLHSLIEKGLAIDKNTL